MGKKKTQKATSIKATSIGGQAVMEGVMMRGESSMATAVRDSDGIIRIESKKIKSSKKRNWFFRLPIVRGVVNFLGSMVTGTSTLMRSAEVFGEGEPSKFEKWLSEKFKINLMTVVTTLAAIIGVGLSIFLFIFLPHLITSQIIKPGIAFNFIEGGFRILIFIIYLLLVSLLKDIKRVFMYHGAEHKTINCYESGKELNVENARASSRVHNRCGTTFLFFVMLVSILVYSVVNIGSTSFFIKFLIKIALLPIVAGLSYELLKALAKTNFWLWYPLKLPGLLLQRITTSEPDDEMLEVAIAAFNTVFEMEKDSTILEKKFVVAKKISQILKEVKEKLNSVDITENSEAEWIVSLTLNIKRDELNSDKIISPAEVEKIEKITAERMTKRPLWYIIGNTEFYGYKFKVDERALIPRPETELLVEEALKIISKEDKILDLCSGSGCIAVTISKQKDIEVLASDISLDAIELARENALLNDAKVNFICSDMFENIKGKFSVIISNPPYIKREDIKNLQAEIKDYEPKLALIGGDDGLDFYREIAKCAPKFLFKGGMLLLECGENQAGIIKDLLKKFTYVTIIKDFNGVERIIKAVL